VKGLKTETEQNTQTIHTARD